MANQLFNINNFKQNGLKLGGARASLFNVEFPKWPAGVTNVQEPFSFLCESAELPASTIQSVSVPYFGRQIKMAGDRTFADWRVTILNDEDFMIRDSFEAWHNQLNSLVSNLRNLNNPIDYKVDGVKVKQYSKTGELIRAYDFHGIFPTEIGAIALNWNTTNQVETFDVTLTYDYWIPADDAVGIPGRASQYKGQTGDK